MQRKRILSWFQPYTDTVQGIMVHLPWWRHAFLGYILGFLLVMSMVLVCIFCRQLHFIWTPFCLATVIVGFVWGVGPALITMILGFLAFNLFLVPQYGIFSQGLWTDIRVFGPFVVAQLTIAFLAAQNASKQARLLVTKQRLESAIRFKDYFIMRAAHELRTPLTSIIGEAQLAQRRLKKREATNDTRLWEEHFAKIQAGMQKLHILIEGLVEINCLPSGELSLRLGDYDIDQLCRDVITGLQADSKHPILFDSSVDHLIISVDHVLIIRALINIMQNAVEYTTKQTPIHVSLYLQSPYVMLRVHNECPPLTEEQQKHVFEPFYRTPYAEQVFREGLGLGLTISKAIIERHHGAIWLDSLEKNGYTCLVKIPIQRDMVEKENCFE